MSAYQNAEAKVCYNIADMNHQTRDDLRSREIGDVIQATRCIYWLELLEAKLVAPDHVPADAIRIPMRIAKLMDEEGEDCQNPTYQSVRFRLIVGASELYSGCCDVDDLGDNAAGAIRQDIHAIVTGRDADEFAAMDDEAIIQAAIDGAKARLEEMEQEIEGAMRIQSLMEEHGAKNLRELQERGIITIAQ